MSCSSRYGIIIPESRRDQEEGGELDSHEEVRLSFAGPGEMKRREVVLDPQESPEEGGGDSSVVRAPDS